MRPSEPPPCFSARCGAAQRTRPARLEARAGERCQRLELLADMNQNETTRDALGSRPFCSVARGRARKVEL